MPFPVTRRGSTNLTYAQTRRRYLWTPTRGVRAYVGQDTWEDKVRSIALVLPKSTAFSHETAARIIGLPLPDFDDSVTVTREGGKVRRKAVTSYQRKLAGDVEVWKGLIVTKPLRTWRDLGASLEVPDLVAMADVLLRRSLCSVEDLQSAKHPKPLAEAALLADAGSWSPRESILRVAMHRAGLPAPQLNVLIVQDGTVLGTADFLWREYRVIADYDGGHHNARRQRHQDAQTRDDYRYHGWDHVPLTSQMGIDQMVDRVARALRRRGWSR